VSRSFRVSFQNTCRLTPYRVPDREDVAYVNSTFRDGTALAATRIEIGETVLACVAGERQTG
jgi:hypothetical protein